MPSRSRLTAAWLLLTAPLIAQSPAAPPAPDQSAAELYRLVNGLTVTPRVLLIGMHPDDEDSQLILWLSRGHHIETAYLSITRGEAGQNFGGGELGSSLGAVRTQEALAARRIDGAKQFFTRAFDFGFARDTNDVFKHWQRDSIVGDIVAVIRSFRPHLIIVAVPDSVADGDGQHQALGPLIDFAFLAADAEHFPPLPFGALWPVSKVYRYGRDGQGLRLETTGYDRVLGKTYAELALESRSQQRSQGLIGMEQPQPDSAAMVMRPEGSVPPARADVVELRRVAYRGRPSSAVDQSLFGGIDTSFARLAAKAPPDVAAAIPIIAAFADSARRALDLRNLATTVPFLAEIARLSTNARGSASWCQHPSANATAPAVLPIACDPTQLDLDASIDLVRERSTAALLTAAGVAIQVTADRELVASSDTARVTISMVNHGLLPFTLSDLALSGSAESLAEPIVVAPGSEAHVTRLVTGLADPRPWWVGPRGGDKRGGDRFDAVPSSADGVSQTGLTPASLGMLGVAVPENIRRPSDVAVTVTVSGATVRTSLGPVVYRHADALVGLQNRPLAGMPNVTLQFARGLDWIPRDKQLTRALRVAVKSHSDHEQQIALRVVAPRGIPAGLRVDSLPASLRVGPHEELDLFVKLHGKLEGTGREPLGLAGAPLAQLRDSASRETMQIYQTGLQTVERDYLPPIRFLPSSGEWIQPIDITVPPQLMTLYVSGVRDEIASALTQVGVWTTEVSTADQLLSIDLAKVTTVAIGARAFETKPELLGQAARLLDFVRKGGTLVVLRGDYGAAASRLYPYAIALAQPRAERVGQADARVTVIDPGARVLNWPNKIVDQDWAGWVGERARWMPSTADPRYAKIIEVHDTGQSENRNAILVARVGKGVIAYTTLALDQQIAGGVPGGLRLLVNLLCAGLAPVR